MSTHKGYKPLSTSNIQDGEEMSTSTRHSQSVCHSLQKRCHLWCHRQYWEYILPIDDQSMEPDGIITEEEEKSDENRSLRRQYVAALLANLITVCVGSTLGWTSSALPDLQGDTNTTLPIRITVEEGSWISGILPIGALVGALPAGYMADAIGRKTFLLTLTAPCIISWLLIILADTSLLAVFIGRFIAGLMTGVVTVVVPFYTEEIAEPSIRGNLGAYTDFNMCIGVLFIYIVGAVLPYFWVAIVPLVLPVLFLITFIWMPESPSYLVSKGRNADAQKSLVWLRNGGETYDVQPELQELINYYEESSQSKQKLPFMTRIRNLFSGFSLTSYTAKSVIIVLILMFFTQATGINAFIFYTVEIFHDAGSDLSPYICAIIVGGIQTISEFISTLVVDRVGRKPLLLTSSTVQTICMACMSAYFFVKDGGSDISSWTWLPLVMLNLYIFSFALAYGPLPWFMMAELVPTSAKEWAGPAAVGLNWSLVFLVTKEFPSMMLVLGGGITYGIFCGMAVLSIAFVAFLVPETKGKSREELQQITKNK